MKRGGGFHLEGVSQVDEKRVVKRLEQRKLHERELLPILVEHAFESRLVLNLHRVLLPTVTLDDLEHLPKGALAERARNLEVVHGRDDKLLGFEVEHVLIVPALQKVGETRLLDHLHADLDRHVENVTKWLGAAHA